MKRRKIFAASASLLTALGLNKLNARAQKPPKSGRYSCKILAIDGGGIRGVIPAYILQLLEAQLGKRIYECFDIIAGTSTGGIITLGLTSPIASKGNQPYFAADILNFYLNNEKDLFVYQSSGDFEAAKYYGTNTSTSPPTGIEPWLQSKLTPTLTLSQAQKTLASLGKPIPKQVLTTTYTVNGAPGVAIGPYTFNWVDAAANPADDYHVWEAARATSAAPTYFPIARVGSGATNGSKATARWCVDGGVAANNPVLYALSWATRLGLLTSLSDVLVVSLGTGLYNTAFKIPDQGNWGTIQWLDGTDVNGKSTVPLLNVLSMSNVLVPDQQLQTLLPKGNYYRLEPTIPFSEASMDGTDAPALLNTVSDYLGPKGSGYFIYQAVLSALRSS
ncbi:patatin-like phospholipase family protein [Kovacikia minuta CCNUW1]|uniref:patatin-like phospholipase family protein n=1 Tax=Kovacikia minuta TaxID=2931930 RepID=UPI001CCF202C|nr:patatin-like phospholipase family protein [Kovacikia minuta]UBF28115.1 patatin-like phospholipase family protein [Kovacikia minuta CCNUW1]